jgi:spore germination protein YaaH
MKRIALGLLLLSACHDDNTAETPPAAPSRQVYGYAYKSELASAALRADIDRGLLTTVCIHAAWVTSTGDLVGVPSAGVDEFVGYCHARGVKVDLNVALFTSAPTRTVLDNHPAKVAGEIVEAVVARGYDGAGLDFEAVPASYKSKYADFVELLAESLHAIGRTLTVDVAQQVGAHEDAARLSAAADALFIMGYCYYGGWSTHSGPNAPLTRGGTWYRAYDSDVFDPDRAASWLQQVGDPSKLILGVPLYGQRWRTTRFGIKAPVYSGTMTALSLKSIEQQYAAVERVWEEASQTPYREWTSAGQTWQVWYDDAESLDLKFAAAREAGLGGIGFWKLPWATEAVWEEVRRYRE